MKSLVLEWVVALLVSALFIAVIAVVGVGFVYTIGYAAGWAAAGMSL